MGRYFRPKNSNPKFLRTLISKAREREQKLASLSDAEFSRHAVSLLDQAALDASRGEIQHDQICSRLATGGEAVFRSFGFRLHDVQFLAIIASSLGNVVEMHTGEGKTLVAGITAYVRSVDGLGVHVATTNDYLAARDHEELVETYERLGISSMLLPTDRNLMHCRAAYASHVTYGPGYQFGFDYLYDQLALRDHNPRGLGQTVLREINGVDLSQVLGQYRPLDFTVVDEADSVLIDEATTPLVISSGPVEEKDAEPYRRAAEVVSQMQVETDYNLLDEGQSIELTEAAKQRLHDDLTSSRKRMQLVRPWPEYVANALRAMHVFNKNEHYVVVEGEVQIVDQFTGRIHPDRHWQGGLHQAVEAKEGVEVVLRASSIARVTRQRYYGKYNQMSGMSGTMMNVDQEVKTVYQMPTVKIPTNVPSRRKVLHNRFFCSWEAKLQAIAEDCKIRHAAGQPILIGTRTIRESERIFAALEEHNLEAVVLNGVQDKDEAEIVSEAGKFGAITIATNMAGRGTDIKPCSRAKEIGGLHVIGTEPNSSQRVDRQLIGRAARQGDPGSAQFFISAEDELIVTNATRLAKRMTSACKRNGESTTDFSRDVDRVQLEVEHRGRDSRKSMVESDKWMDLVRESVIKD